MSASQPLDQQDPAAPTAAATVSQPSASATDSLHANASSPSLGKYVRMRALSPAELPAHPQLSEHQRTGSPPELRPFLADILAEAESFMTSYLPKKFRVKSSNKQSPPASAPVELLSHELAASDLPIDVQKAGTTGEAWFARTSLHENAAKEGTATWEEFDGGLRANHSQHEKDYTPDVLDAHEVLDWGSELSGAKGTINGWNNVHAYVVEMAHHIPPPLNNRVFSVLVVTARKAEEFLVVQVPIDPTNMSAAKYSGGKGGKTTAGMYCSIERGELIDGGARVKWQMATASDAKGVLPMWAQKMGVPGAVVKDVGLFIGWANKRRAGKT